MRLLRGGGCIAYGANSFIKVAPETADRQSRPKCVNTVKYVMESKSRARQRFTEFWYYKVLKILCMKPCLHKGIWDKTRWHCGVNPHTHKIAVIPSPDLQYCGLWVPDTKSGKDTAITRHFSSFILFFLLKNT